MDDAGSFVLQVKVIPRAKQNAFMEIMSDGRIKIQLKAAPEKGKANLELIAFLARELALPQAKIVLKSGLRSRNKKVAIGGVGAKETLQLIKKKIVRAR